MSKRLIAGAVIVAVTGLTGCSGGGESSSKATTPTSTPTPTRTPLTFGPGLTRQCAEGDTVALSDDRVRQRVGGKASCQILGALQSEVDRTRDQTVHGDRKIVLEVVSTKLNQVRRFDCEAYGTFTHCKGQKPSQVEAWIADSPETLKK